MIEQEDYYRDGTHIESKPEEISKGFIDDVSRTIAAWLRSKKYGRDVREALAQAVELFSVKWYQIKDYSEKTREIATETRERQTTLEGQFTDVMNGATEDYEVINARDSETFGKFSVLDDRLENFEKILNRYVPVGFEFLIAHNLGTNPNVVVKTYDYAIGTEPNGFDSEPGVFGGMPTKILAYDVTYPDANNVKISLPFEYKMADGFTMIQSIADGKVWYLNEDIKTIKVELID